MTTQFDLFADMDGGLPERVEEKSTRAEVKPKESAKTPAASSCPLSTELPSPQQKTQSGLQVQPELKKESNPQVEKITSFDLLPDAGFPAFDQTPVPQELENIEVPVPEEKIQSDLEDEDSPHARALREQKKALAKAREVANRYLLADANINEAFSSLVILRVEQYLTDLEGVKGLPVHDMIVSAAERPLLTWAMEKAQGKQLVAAKILGINRNTLRKKLRMHGFLEGDFE